MNSVALALFVACVIGSTLALDCSAKFKTFHQCLGDSHKKAEAGEKAKFEALKTKIDACYTDNGCTAPAKPQKDKAAFNKTGEHHGNSTQGWECRRAVGAAMKTNFETCIKKAVPDFTFPQKPAEQGKGHEGRKHFGHKEDDKEFASCAKKDAVRQCIRAIFNSSAPTEDEKRANFKAACDAKQNCLTALGADCQTQMENFEKAACECRQQQRQQEVQVRASIPACQGVQEKKGKGPQKEHKQETCDKKDYCKLGYDAFVQDHKKGKGKGKGPKN